MDHTPLTTLLANYTTDDAAEAAMVADTLRFVADNPVACYSRELLQGHITASAWIVDEERTHVLLIHHSKLDKWFQPGGHSDGNADTLAVAIKEAEEETGLAVRPLSGKVYDVDIHTIPERKGVPEHLHYDIRFVLTAVRTPDELPGNREVKEIKWVPLTEVARYNASESIMRMVRKPLM